MTDIRISLVKTMLTKMDHIRMKTQAFDYPRVEVIRDLSYCGGDISSEHCLDLYRPKNSKGALPVILDIHGGGLVYGDKRLNQWTSAEMASRGYLVLTLNYPLLPAVTMAQQLSDLGQVFSYIEGLASQYPLDLERVFLKGDSAGGLLCILACAGMNHSTGDPWSRNSFKIRALALLHPMVELRRVDILAYIEKFQARSRLPGGEKGDPWSMANLVHNLPPAWVVSSRNDILFNKEARKLVKLLKAKDKTVEFHEVGFTLTRPLNHIFMVTQPELRESQMLYDSLDRFLRRQ